jgi:cysteinyl-tRNA synthetase
MDIKFFNTYSRSEEVFHPLGGNEVKMYTCGPTVYNFAHIGNFRAYIFEDFLRRTLKYSGLKVIQVMNLTDVDDKTIRDSIAAKTPLDAYTKKFKDAFFRDLETLRVDKAEYYPEATKHIPEMIEIIKVLLEKGYAYVGDDKSVYYSVAKFADYGKLARIDMENQRPGVRVKTDEYGKDSVADFALWKVWDENDGDVFWESPWGKGRPGWHIECSAMSMKYLGKTFDIHTGGIDNMFPHHEDELAQSEAANGCRFVNYWLHCEHLIVNGQKMSKSLGNFFTLSDIFAKGFSGRELRWVLLGTHYRKKLNFTLDACAQAKLVLQKFSDFFVRLHSVKNSGLEGDSADNIVLLAKASFTAAVQDDLNISEALASVFELQHEANKLIESGKMGATGAATVLDQFRDFDRIFAVFDLDSSLISDVPEEINRLVEERLTAKKSKNYARADEIRKELLAKGWIVEDTAGGSRVKKAAVIQ